MSPLRISLVCLILIQTGFAQLSPQERIITEEKDVINGVIIDYSYNDTSTSEELPEGGLSSVPGCPKNEGGNPWLLYYLPETNGTKCFLAGSRGPCEITQVFTLKDTSNYYGVCTCDCFEFQEWDDFVVSVDEYKPDKLCVSMADSQLRVFVGDLQKCFEVYEQGPCKTDEWLVATPEDRPEGINGPRIWTGRASCEKRLCESGQIPFKGSTSSSSEKNVTCGHRFASYFAAANVEPSQCEASGKKFSNLLKKCIKTQPKIKGAALG